MNGVATPDRYHNTNKASPLTLVIGLHLNYMFQQLEHVTDITHVMTISTRTVKCVFIDFPSEGSDYHLDLPLNPYGEKGTHTRWIGLYSDVNHEIYVFSEVSNSGSYSMHSFNAYSEYVHIETRQPSQKDLNWMVLTENNFVFYTQNDNPLYPVHLNDNRSTIFVDQDEVERLNSLRDSAELQQDWFSYLQRADMKR